MFAAGDAGLSTQATKAASGEWGSCPWSLSSKGTLTVRPGKASGSLYGSLGDAGVETTAVKRIVFAADGGSKVVAPKSCKGLLGGYYGEFTNVSFVDLSGLDTSKVTDMSYMFEYCSSLRSIDLSSLDTSKVTSMICMFAGCSSLRSADLKGLKAPKLEDMSCMFDGCRSLRSAETRGLKAPKLKWMNSMFFGCKSLRSIDLKGLEVPRLIDMEFMFYGCKSLRSVNLSGFRGPRVTRIDYMFYGCKSLGSVDLSGFKGSRIEGAAFMFYSCKALKRIYAPKAWSLKNCKDSQDMFRGCKKLVGGAGTKYSAKHTDVEYARIDKKGKPGYFTLKK